MNADLQHGVTDADMPSSEARQHLAQWAGLLRDARGLGATAWDGAALRRALRWGAHTEALVSAAFQRGERVLSELRREVLAVGLAGGHMVVPSCFRNGATQAVKMAKDSSNEATVDSTESGVTTNSLGNFCKRTTTNAANLAIDDLRCARRYLLQQLLANRFLGDDLFETTLAVYYDEFPDSAASAMKADLQRSVQAHTLVDAVSDMLAVVDSVDFDDDKGACDVVEKIKPDGKGLQLVTSNSAARLLRRRIECVYFAAYAVPSSSSAASSPTGAMLATAHVPPTKSLPPGLEAEVNGVLSTVADLHTDGMELILHAASLNVPLSPPEEHQPSPT